MAPPVCEFDYLAVVLLGSFNPAIFNPQWIAAHKILPDTETESALVKLIMPDIASFDVGSWLSIEVAPDRFQAAASFERALPLRDFIVNVFTLLEHTPIRTVGINRLMHFRMESKEARDAVGFRLVPPIAWPEELLEPVMRSVRMQGRRDINIASVNSLSVEPSLKILDTGVFVAANEEFQLAQPANGAAGAISIVTRHFESGIRFGKDVAQAVLSEKIK